MQLAKSIGAPLMDFAYDALPRFVVTDAVHLIEDKLPHRCLSARRLCVRSRTSLLLCT